MRKLATSLAILMMTGTAVFAQDTAEIEEPAAAVEKAELQIGAPYLKEEHGAWTIRCTRAPLGQADPCDMFQVLKNSEGGPVAEVMVQPAGENGGTMVIAVPLGTFLPAGVKIGIDGNELGSIPFITCTRTCVSRVTLKEAELQAFKNGNVAQLTLSAADAPQVPVSVDASLTGFTAAFNNLPKAAQ